MGNIDFVDYLMSALAGLLGLLWHLSQAEVKELKLHMKSLEVKLSTVQSNLTELQLDMYKNFTRHKDKNFYSN